MWGFLAKAAPAKGSGKGLGDESGSVPAVGWGRGARGIGIFFLTMKHGVPF